MDRLCITCKSLRALADGVGVYASLDMFKDPLYVGVGYLLLRRCYDAGNPSTIYIKGVEYFYMLDRHEEGIAYLKSAADADFHQALYTYAMTSKNFNEDEEYFSRFTRKSVAQIGMVARSSYEGWNWSHNAAFLTKRDHFISTVLPSFYKYIIL
ncbi:hypothetical protein Bca52824_011216 [Brassica carinata]|uniref:At2g35280-like TPR domain-containing protein n=1 Tax=Brassica carinata TaxID=52824 RepID=A0A8X7WCU0_BRACI|nr:hypothetical protein Bca52824_011216 [Brassica carinata]